MMHGKKTKMAAGGGMMKKGYAAGGCYAHGGRR
jgi:hypothetical protein